MKADIKKAVAFVHHIACKVSEKQITHRDNTGMIEFCLAKEGTLLETAVTRPIYDVALDGIKHAYPESDPIDLADARGPCFRWTIGPNKYIELEQLKGDGVYLRLVDRN